LGGALHQHREGHAFQPCQSLNFIFQVVDNHLGVLNCDGRHHFLNLFLKEGKRRITKIALKEKMRPRLPCVRHLSTDFQGQDADLQ